MALVVDAGAVRVRSRVSFGAPAGSLSINPRAEKFDNAAARDELAFPELDCVRALLSPAAIEAAQARAAALGTGADRVLIASGALDEETYLRALGEQLGVVFEPLDGIPRARCPLGDERLIESAAHGMVPLLIDGQLCLTVAPRAAAARCIGGLIKDNSHLARTFRFTCSDHINRFAMRCASTTIADHASAGLKQTWPSLSAAPPRWRGSIIPIAIVGLGALAAATMAAAATLYALEIMLAMIFLAWIGLRLAGAFVDWVVRERAPELPDDRLPTYTVITALYREASSVDGLLSAIAVLWRKRHKLFLVSRPKSF